MKKTFTEHNEDQLMNCLANDGIDALEELYKRHAPSIYKYAARILGNPTEADDIVHEVFLRVWRNRDKYDPSSHFRAWAIRICANLCIDRKRKADCRNTDIDETVGLHDAGASPEDLAISNDRLAIIMQAFHLLPFADQQIFALRFDADLSVAETAEILDCSIRTVHYRTAEAIKHLQIAAGVFDE
jgi:RNA polymerase sigma-70 factor (ECF subfamily)